MKIDIEKFIEDKGNEISEKIFQKYGEDPVIKHKSIFESFWDNFLGGSITRLKVEGDVYERSLHEATKFFLENSDIKFNDKILKTIIYYIKTKTAEPKKIKNLNKEELLATAIKFDTLDSLLKKGLVL
ncbi:MAG: hypothetical protein WC895_02115 [Candidatus Shapirobacteria bacterium]|jgi:hypothetical protein